MNAGPTYAGGPARRTGRIAAIAVLALAFFDAPAIASDSNATVPSSTVASTEVAVSSTTTAAAAGTTATATTTTAPDVNGGSSGTATSSLPAADTTTAPVTSPAGGTTAVAPATSGSATARAAPADASAPATTAPAPEAKTTTLPASNGTSSKSTVTPAPSTQGGDGKGTLPEDSPASKIGERSTAPPVRTRRSDRPRSERGASPSHGPAGIGGQRPTQTTPAPDPRVPTEERPGTGGVSADHGATIPSSAAAGPATPAAAPAPAPSAAAFPPATSDPAVLPAPYVLTPPAPATFAPAPLAANAHVHLPWDFMTLHAHRYAASSDADPGGGGAPSQAPGVGDAAAPAHLTATPTAAGASGPSIPQHAGGRTTGPDTRREATAQRPSAPPAAPEAPVSPPIPTGTGADAALAGTSSPTGAPVIALLFAAATLVAASAWRPIGPREARLPQILAGMAIERPG